MNVSLISGNNFSGRSNFLSEIIKRKIDGRSHGIKVGEIPSNYVSGCAPTVEDEIELHSIHANKEYKAIVISFLRKINFNTHFFNSPFDLSGGEQAMLVIICGLLLQPQTLCIDTTLEQLNSNWRIPLLNELSNDIYCKTHIYISDNRHGEYNFNFNVHSVTTTKEKYDRPFNKIECPDNLFFFKKSTEIILDNVSFGYTKDKLILKNLNYKFVPGKIYHLKGENGVGKSTLSKLLAGLLKPLNGTIYRNGENTYKYPGKFVGYSFQDPDEQIFSNTVSREIVSLKMSDSYKIKNSKVVLSAFGLQNILESHPLELPFVIRKRIALAATLANERDWFILDEPTIGQDVQNTKELIKIVNLFASFGKGIILISHSNEFINSFDNLIELNIIDGLLN